MSHRNPLEIVSADIERKPVLARMLELYLYDLTDYSGQDVGADGNFGYRYLDNYWEEPERFPYLFRLAGAWTGFGLVNTYSLLPENAGGVSMAEFFVLKKYRRNGVGRSAFRQLVELHPGRWEVRVEADNQRGLAFWPVVIHELTGGAYRRTQLDATVWNGPIFSFDFWDRSANQRRDER